MAITEKRLKELERAEAKLNALEAGGVNNWENYDGCLKDYRAENELEEKREQLIDALAYVFSECAYVPSERGIGTGFNDDLNKQCMKIFEKLGVIFKNMEK